MDSKIKHSYGLVAFGVCLFVALLNLTSVLEFLGNIVRLILPIITGGILAIFLHVPVNGIKKRIERCIRKMKKRPSDKLINGISFVLAMLCIILVLALVLGLLVPELIRSFQSIYQQIKDQIPNWLTFLETHNINAEWLEELLGNINLDEVVQNISNSIDSILSNMVDALTSTVNIVATAGFGIIIAIYCSVFNRYCRNSPFVCKARYNAV